MNSIFKDMGPLVEHPMFRDGWKAYMDGHSRWDCPHEDIKDVTIWLIGHHDARLKGWKDGEFKAAGMVAEIEKILEKKTY